MVQQPVQDGGGQDRIVEDLAPVDEAFVAGQDDGGALVASGDQAEEQAGSTISNWGNLLRQACRTAKMKRADHPITTSSSGS